MSEQLNDGMNACMLRAMQAGLQRTLTGRKSSSVVPVASLWASLSSKLRDSNRSSSANGEKWYISGTKQ